MPTSPEFSRPWVLVTGDFVLTGGMDRANYALADYLSRQNFETHLVAHRVAPELSARTGVQWHRVAKPLNSYLLGEPLLSRRGRTLARRLSRRGANILVNGGNCPWPGLNWAHYVHAAYHRQPARAGWALQAQYAYDRWHALRMEARSWRQARIVIANSERTRSDLIARAGVPPGRIRVVYYGIDPGRFAPAENAERAVLRRDLGWPQAARVVIFIGALGDQRKGFDVLFHAWRQLPRLADYNLQLMVVVSGREQQSWRRQLRLQGLESEIRFLGFRSDVPTLLRTADLLVSPARYEAYGLGVHEALCCGLPAIVSATAGVAEKFSSQLGPLLLPDSEDTAGLTDRLMLWLRNMNHWRDAARELSVHLRRRTWDVMAAEIIQLALRQNSV